MRTACAALLAAAARGAAGGKPAGGGGVWAGSFVGLDNQLIRVGDSIVWETGDAGVAKGSIGVVTRFTTAGKAVAMFHGAKRRLPADEVRKLPQFAVGDAVTWTQADKAVPAGAVGRVVRFDSKNFTVVSFDGVRKHVHPMELRPLPKLKVGTDVVWETGQLDRDVPAGSVGKVARMDSKGLAVVLFGKGVKKHIKLSELREKLSLTVGDEVSWPSAPAGADVPRGAVGTVTRFDSRGEAVVKFRGGKKKHIQPGLLAKVGKLAAGDSVVWQYSDSETPKGAVGKVMRFDAQGQAIVRFTKGQRRRLPLGELRRAGEGGVDGHQQQAKNFKILQDKPAPSRDRGAGAAAKRGRGVRREIGE